ncbi:hypothetical protein AB1K89_08660 [Sporosarcina sp. 179-K 8C2 HS]|uniref:hypothetical protein n=1 Tax=Sporosarcina sp. 179-K 8C2 HS TaxID=3142387 RepID=UPI0039A1BBF4
MKGYKVAVEATKKIICITRTIADLEGSKLISESALQESIKWKSIAPELYIPLRSEGV